MTTDTTSIKLMAQHSNAPLVLTVDDEQPIRDSFCFFLEDAGFEVRQACNGLEGLRSYEQRRPDLMLLDLSMPEMNGLELLSIIRKRDPDLPIIVISGTGSVASAVEALRLGAWDYLFKPVQNLDIVLHAVERAIQQVRLRDENRHYHNYLVHEVERQTAAIERAAAEEKVMGRLGRLALRDMDLVNFANRFLTTLVNSVTWLGLEAKGAVLLTDGREDSYRLEMVARHGLEPEVSFDCKSVPRGECLCGQALLENRLIHKRHVDADHTIHHHRMGDHGHYVVPFFHSDRALGVLMLYVPVGHEDHHSHRRFLRRIGDLLGLSVARRHAERHIEYLAFHDRVTKLPNRQRMSERIEREMKYANSCDRHGALLLIDIDNVKMINESLGHSAGDQLLVAIAERLSAYASREQTLMSMGGDEFALVLPPTAETPQEMFHHADAVAEAIHSIIEVPLTFGEHNHVVSCSIGAVLFPGGSESVEAVLADADAALSLAKKEGRGLTRFYSSELRERVYRRLRIENELRTAVKERLLIPYFQPQVDQEGVFTGAEVLLRWNHSEMGWISPAEFIPVAEETGLIVPISKWLFSEIFRKVGEWQADSGMSAIQSVAINISPNLFRQPDFVDTLINETRRQKCDPQRIVLEITEGVLIHDPNATINKMNQLRRIGFRFSIDDFGTGYSSLNYLKNIPINELKIDQSFVRNCHIDSANAMIVDTIATMGKNFNLHLIAEGVENEYEKQCLERREIPTFQGFYFSKPLPESAFVRAVMLNSTTPSPGGQECDARTPV